MNAHHCSTLYRFVQRFPLECDVTGPFPSSDCCFSVIPSRKFSSEQVIAISLCLDRFIQPRNCMHMQRRRRQGKVGGSGGRLGSGRKTGIRAQDWGACGRVVTRHRIGGMTRGPTKCLLNQRIGSPNRGVHKVYLFGFVCRFEGIRRPLGNCPRIQNRRSRCPM